MNVLLITSGSLGDVVPYVALGQRLLQAGHSATLCTSDRFQPLIEGHGLSYAFMDDGLVRLLESDLHRKMFERRPGLIRTLRTLRALHRQGSPLFRRMLDQSWEAASQAAADVILYNPVTVGGVHFAEKLGIPAALVSPWPQLVATGEFPTTGFPDLGCWWNRQSYRAVLKLCHFLGGGHVRRWRREHGLPPLPAAVDLLHTSSGQPLPFLHCFSAAVVPRPHDWPETAHVTGYWFLSQHSPWQPPPELERFLQGGEPPVYVGFGSMARRRPEQLTQIVVEALQRVGVRGIISKGWGGLDPSELPDSLLRIHYAPHDWLFPRVAAVVHHGGAGTTAAGLRAGVPAITCPFFADQPFWGRRLEQLGVGCPPIRQRDLTVAKLAEMIERVTRASSLSENAARLGAVIRSEDGAGNAVALIEKMVGQWGEQSP